MVLSSNEEWILKADRYGVKDIRIILKMQTTRKPRTDPGKR